MRRADFKLVKSSGGRMLLARVAVVVAETDTGLEITVSPLAYEWIAKTFGPKMASLDSAPVQAAIRGARYAVDHVAPDIDRQRLSIVIESIIQLAVDENEDAIAYAACFAVWEALGIQGDPVPEINAGRVHFPETC